MSTIRFQFELQRSDMRPGVTLRTLVLMVELLLAVLALQYLATIRPAKAGAVWLANDRPATMSAPAETSPDLIAPLARR
jgi:hypothetical protein